VSLAKSTMIDSEGNENDEINENYHNKKTNNLGMASL